MDLMTFTIGFEQRNCRGEQVCGDAVAIERNDEAGMTHIAVVDGLGHGEAANAAAMAFVEYFREHMTPDMALVDMLQKVSRAIERTRGVAASVIRLDGVNRQMQYAGVGNVELSAVSASPIRPISKPGIVGRRMGRLMLFEYALHPGDLLAVFTDGISSRFNLESMRNLELSALCRELMSQWGKDHDDATVVTIRCN